MSALDTEPLSIVEMATRELRRAIVDGSLQPGSPLPIAELSSRLAVSHIPIREALKRLESEALVQLPRGRAAVVTAIGDQDLADVLRIRAVLEAETLAAAVERASAVDVAAAEARWEELRVSAGTTADDLLALDRAFHDALLRPAMTPWMSRLQATLWPTTDRYLHLLLRSGTQPSATWLQDHHEPLLQAARDRSPSAAREAVRTHFATEAQLVAPLLPADC
jgi:DNA-binding GntR family transcriptional regulator